MLPWEIMTSVTASRLKLPGFSAGLQAYLLGHEDAFPSPHDERPRQYTITTASIPFHTKYKAARQHFELCLPPVGYCRKSRPHNLNSASQQQSCLLRVCAPRRGLPVADRPLPLARGAYDQQPTGEPGLHVGDAVLDGVEVSRKWCRVASRRERREPGEREASKDSPHAPPGRTLLPSGHFLLQLLYALPEETQPLHHGSPATHITAATAGSCRCARTLAKNDKRIAQRLSEVAKPLLALL